MTTLAVYLGRDHRVCDDQYALAEARVVASQWESAEIDFYCFRQMLERHLGLEEQVMFPALEQAVGAAGSPTNVMRAEHRHMRAIVQGMADAISAHACDAFFDHADTLRMLMRQHNLKEESILYPMADHYLGERQDHLVAEMIAFEPAAAALGSLP